MPVSFGPIASNCAKASLMRPESTTDEVGPPGVRDSLGAMILPCRLGLLMFASIMTERLPVFGEPA